MRYFIIFFFFTLSLLGFDYHLKPYNISQGINCFFGLSSEANRENGGNMINSCYIETEEGYVVIDSGPTYRYAQESYQIMEEEKKLPVKYVINTSSDEVHILGNSFFKEQGATLLGPYNYKRHIVAGKIPQLREKISEDAMKNTKFISLDNYIEGDSTITLGSVNIEIKRIPNDREHLIVYVPSKKTLFAGDMIFNNRIVPLKDKRSLLVWQEGLKILKSLQWDDIISSHGYKTRRSALKNTESYLALLKNEVGSSIDRGESKKEAIENVKLDSFSEDKLYNFWHPKNVATAYDELKAYEIIDIPSKSAIVITNQDDQVMKVQKSVDKASNLNVITKPKPKIEVKSQVKQNTKVESKVKKSILKSNQDIHYRSFETALQRAKASKKIVFIKVRSTNCKYCDQLDRVLKKNSQVKKLLNNYFESVKINMDDSKVPLDIRIASTPTIIFIRPSDKKVLMELPGIRALGELLEILNEAVDDGHNGGYLKP